MLNKNEKIAIVAYLFIAMSKHAVAVQFMAGLFQPMHTPNFAIVAIYWIYSNYVRDLIIDNYCIGMEKLLFHKVISKVNPEEYDIWLRQNDSDNLWK